MIKNSKIYTIHGNTAPEIYWLPVIVLFFLFLFTLGCRGSIPIVQEPSSYREGVSLDPMGYSIQAGAFSIVDNAVRLAASLQEKGFDAYYFLHESSLYKVRFGNYSNRESARAIAEDLLTKGILTEYMLVMPEDYQREGVNKSDKRNLRRGIVLSAKRFLGVPYHWGGDSYKTGFDCSGFTMAVYKLNGLNLPRTTKEQWASGNPVNRKQLSEGDLVFFSTKKRNEISHVGVYIGGNKFIHAPGEGKKIRTESLFNEYFKSRYQGARTYL